jgi:hypothetical protein
MTDQLKELLERVEAATGLDREIDVWLFALLGDKESPWGIGDIEYALTDPELTCDPPSYTASLDACLALVERVRGTKACVIEIAKDHARAGLGQAGLYAREARTAELALLAALLRAKIEAAP